MTSNRISSSSGVTRALAHRARRNFPLAAIVGMLLSAAGAGAAAGQTQILATAMLPDALSGDRIVSDGGGDYDQNENDCVVSRVQNGQYFLRTVSPNCTPLRRNITLDFTKPVTPLTNCNVFDPNSNTTWYACGPISLPDVRIIAGSLFKTSASSTSVILPFSLFPDFSGTAFELDFELAVPFTAPSSTERVLLAGPGAVAHLYQIGAHGHKVSIGRYYMPFQLTVTEP